MDVFKVVEHFASINGEGTRAGQLAYFIRFAGCNLGCTFCDTAWANEPDAPYTSMSASDIYEAVRLSGIKNVTLTGGEPLLQKNIAELIDVLLADASLSVEIETNGSVDLAPFIPKASGRRPIFTMDYKLPSSGMEIMMLISNFELLTSNDAVKFVAGTHDDLVRARNVINAYDLASRCHVYISPVFGAIEPVEIVEFMKENQMNDVNLGLQLHKVIWAPDKRGV
jgi:7-carboxy-7-deazaguanine synthase